MKTIKKVDVLILGSGAAGLTTALRLSKKTKILVVAKRELTESNTFYAQGGISAVLDGNDSKSSHIEDTLIAGAGLCDINAVSQVVDKGPDSIKWLIELGMEFTKISSQPKEAYHLTKEGGHSHRRVIHNADATGKELEFTLVDAAKTRSNIEFLEYYIAVDLITSDKLGDKEKHCIGAYALNLKTNKVLGIQAKVVVLATGGAGKVYLYTSNPDIATGDGIAMAWRAGCRVANMEFIQFHPTCLYHPQAKSFLITEAVRGEGGILRLPDGTRFMPKFDKRAELAPRDIVARAIDHEMKRLGASCVYLDISHKSPAFIKEHFPTIYKKCLSFGIDICKEAIPVVPAAHYTSGGVLANKQAATDIKGLYAIGEVAYSGLHGANRMASNSLLECLVYAQLGADQIQQELALYKEVFKIPIWDESRVTNSDEEVVVSHNWDELRRFMWDYVGIVRTNKRLQRAKRRVNLLKHEIREYYSNFRVTNDLLELRNIVEVADLIIRSALQRRESRGLHYTLDFPCLDELQKSPTILIPDSYRPRLDCKK